MSRHKPVSFRLLPPATLQQELVTALVRCADEMLRQFGPQELTNLVWSLSMLQRTGTQLPPNAHVRRCAGPTHKPPQGCARGAARRGGAAAAAASRAELRPRLWPGYAAPAPLPPPGVLAAP